MTRRRGDLEIAGYSITTRNGRIYLIDQVPDGDPGMSAGQARQLAKALDAAAGKADKQAGGPPA